MTHLAIDTKLEQHRNPFKIYQVSEKFFLCCVIKEHKLTKLFKL